MASVFKPTYNKKNPKTGKITRRKLKKWYVKYRDADGIVHRVPGHTDKAVAQQLAAQLEHEVELEKLGIDSKLEIGLILLIFVVKNIEPETEYLIFYLEAEVDL